METFHKSVKYICITTFLIFFNDSCWNYINHLEKLPVKEEKKIEKVEKPKTLDQMFPIIPKEFILPQGPLIIPQERPPNYAGN